MVQIRPATDRDLSGILQIYNDVIATSTAVYSFEPETLAQRQSWLALRQERGFPVLCAVDETAAVLGFASFGDWRGAWPGYRHTVEHSVHVRTDQRGRGIGSALIQALIPEAVGCGMHVMIGGIDAVNEASLRLHDRLGFERVSHFREVGHKFGHWLDLIFVQKVLTPGEIPDSAQPHFVIREDDLSAPSVRELLALHLAGMRANSPADGVFALDLSGLSGPDVTVWSVWDGPQIVGIGALKRLGANAAEIKSMRTHPDHLRRGVARQLLDHIIADAGKRGFERLSLETGTGPAFEPALSLYRHRGFVEGEPFAEYERSDFNRFFHLKLD